jgi:hypothetical protein
MDAGIELAGQHIDNGGNLDYLDWGDALSSGIQGQHLRWADRPSRPVTPRDAAELVHDFLGRPYNFDAFEQYLSG